MADPHIPDAAVEAYLRVHADATAPNAVPLWEIPDVAAGVRERLLAALPFLLEQWRCNDPDLRTPCIRCPDLPPLADHEMLPHAREHHPEVLLNPGPYTATICANGLCAIFPGRCRLVEKWSGVACDCPCHRGAAESPVAAEAPATPARTPQTAGGDPGGLDTTPEQLTEEWAAAMLAGLIPVANSALAALHGLVRHAYQRGQVAGPAGGETREEWAVNMTRSGGFDFIGPLVNDPDWPDDVTEEQWARQLAADPPAGVPSTAVYRRTVHTGPWVLAPDPEEQP